MQHNSKMAEEGRAAIARAAHAMNMQAVLRGLREKLAAAKSRDEIVQVQEHAESCALRWPELAAPFQALFQEATGILNPQTAESLKPKPGQPVRDFGHFNDYRTVSFTCTKGRLKFDLTPLQARFIKALHTAPNFALSSTQLNAKLGRSRVKSRNRKVSSIWTFKDGEEIRRHLLRLSGRTWSLNIFS